MIMYKWTRITDLDETAASLGHRGIPELAGIWTRYRESLSDSPSLDKFLLRLRREWAIETGIIERNYEIDAGTTLVLIERGFETTHVQREKVPNQTIDLLNDNFKALDVLFDFVASRRELTTSFIKELHSLITQNQHYTEALDPNGSIVQVELLRGAWKQQPNNPRRLDGKTHEYCPVEHVASEMDELLRMHSSHSSRNIPIEVQAAWLHHRFTQIHPFQDGNGRVARALATLLFIKQGWLPMAVNRNDRESYLNALEQADAGHLIYLVSLFARIEERMFTQALAAVLPPPEVLIEAAAELQRDSSGASERDKNRITNSTNNVWGQVGNRLNTVISHFASNFPRGKPEMSGGNFAGIEPLLYGALPPHLRPLSTPTHAVRVTCQNPKFELIYLQFAAGPLFRGVMAAAMFRHKDSDVRLCSEPFVFTIDEDPNLPAQRVGPWLEETLSKALGEWLTEFTPQADLLFPPGKGTQ